MIDREKLEKVVRVVDEISAMGIECDLEIYSSGRDWRVWVSCSQDMEESQKRKLIAITTPLVGKMEVSGADWQGRGYGFAVYLWQAAACKILGYKTETKTVTREIQKEPEYETVEEEVRTPITDCDIKSGKFSMEDIEVEA